MPNDLRDVDVRLQLSVLDEGSRHQVIDHGGVICNIEKMKGRTSTCASVNIITIVNYQNAVGYG